MTRTQSYECWGCGRRFRYYARSHVETRCRDGHKLSGRGRDPSCEACQAYHEAWSSGAEPPAWSFVRTKVEHPAELVLVNHLAESPACRVSRNPWPEF